MDELRSIRAFIEVVECGSFSAAARRLNISTSAIARQIKWLEEDINTPLIHRNTRHQTLTVAGKLFFENAREIDRKLRLSKSLARLEFEKVEGHLRVSLRTSAATIIVPALPEFLAQYPDLELEINLSDEPEDLIAKNIDVALWLGELHDTDFVAKRLSQSRRIICASPSYLERRGVPKVPADMVQHNCLLFRKGIYSSSWRFVEVGTEEEIELRVSGNLHTSNGFILLSAALSGIGLILVHKWMVGHDLKEGRLVRVLENYLVRPANNDSPLFAVFHKSNGMSPKVRAFIDFLTPLFK